MLALNIIVGKKEMLELYLSEIPLLSWIVPSEKQHNAKIQQAFLDALSDAVNPVARVIIVTDAGFQNVWFRHIKSLGWDFIGRIRGNIQMRLDSKGVITGQQKTRISGSWYACQCGICPLQ